MDAIKIDTLPMNKSLLNSKVSDTSDISKEKDAEILFVDDIDEDDEIRLRLSDDEEVEQDNTSRHSESQETNLDNKINDLEFDVHVDVISKNTSEHHYKGLVNKEKLATEQKAKTRLVEEEDSSGNSSLDEVSVNETADDINDEESTMSGSERIPPLMHSSPKYWSNNFDNRWKGSNNQNRNRHSFSNRNSNDWYNKHQSDKDKFNNRNSFNNHNNHFNRVRHSTGGSYKSHSRENYNKDSRKDNSNETSKIKNKISTSDDTNRLIQENGLSNDLKSKENDSYVKNDNLTNGNLKQNETDSEIKSELKKDEQKFNKSKAPTEVISEKNHSQSDDSILEKPVEENFEVNEAVDKLILILENCEENCEVNYEVKESVDTKINSDSALFSTKNCDVSITESKNETSELQLEEMNKEKENKCSSDEKEKALKDAEHITDIVKSIDSNLQDKTSHTNDISEKDKFENMMEVDDNDKNLCDDIDENSSNNKQINSSSDFKDITIKINKNTDTYADENLENEIRVDNDSFKQNENSTNEFSDNKLSNNVNFDVEPNHLLVDATEITKMEIPESDNKNSPVKNNDKITETMDTENDAESSNSVLITVTESKDLESKVLQLQSSSDKDQENTVENSQLLTVENSYKLEETEKSMEVDKQSENNNIQTKVIDTSSSHDIIDEHEKLSVEEVDLADDDSETATVYSKEDDQDKIDESNESGRAVVHKRRRRKRLSGIFYQEVPPSNVLTENGVRQKRQSARNAEEMIRKEILKNNEEDEESDEKSGRVVTVHYKPKPNSTSLQPQSPPSLKRTLEDHDIVTESLTFKKIRSSSDFVVTPIVKPEKLKKELKEEMKKEFPANSKESIDGTRALVRKISQEDIRGKLQKLSQEDMEALLVQKIVECITIRGEMGKLREQARASKRNQEATRLKCQQLQKQVEGFEMVLKRFTFDKNTNGDKYVPPIKINRSVGLQVNFLSQENGIQNLKQLGTSKPATGPHTSNVTLTNANVNAPVINKTANAHLMQDNRPQNPSPRKVLKTRSPRRPEVGTVIQGSPVVATPTTPAALVMSKSVTAEQPKRTITLQNASNIVQIMPSGQQQTVVVNSSVGGPTTGVANTRPTLSIQRTTVSAPTITKASDLIDLTDEEDKTKTSVVTPMAAINSRLPRVIHTVPGSVALTNATNLRLVQTSAHMPQTAIVSNNSPRVAYVMQSGVNGGPRQLVLTSTNTIRPVTSVSTRNISTISYKPGVSTLTNGTVRVLTTQAPTTMQVSRHPAPLPETSSPESNPSWKLPPPAPSLKISKVTTGIVLSWNMTLTDKYSEIVSYQLYAYQEVVGTNPNAALWKKVGDVRALPLPMACTLTQFAEGNTYYFAVRAVDVHSRFGQYSKPGNISL